MTDIVPARTWRSATSRTVAVTLGAYAASVLVTAALPLVLVRLGIPRVEAVVAASLASVLFFIILAIYAALARTATRAWLHLGAVCVLALAPLWMLR